jgi:hypothetical protein
MRSFLTLFHFLIFTLSNGPAISQNTKEIFRAGQDSFSSDLYYKLLILDSSLFSAFNNCDIENFQNLLDKDLEFYDDRTGLNKSWEKEIASLKNRCSQPSFRIRRELVRSSMQVYPINKYGAVQMGDHLFYETSNDQKEELKGKAKFIHLWKYLDGKWTLARIISYDHQAVGK